MARPKKSDQLTPLELEIMKVLWEGGPASVQTVQQRLPPERNLAYTTVQTMLNLLAKKGKVTRELKDRAYHYSPCVQRSKAVGLALEDIINRLFGGSAESLVMSLVEARQLSPEKLAELQESLKRAKGEGDAGR